MNGDSMQENETNSNQTQSADIGELVAALAKVQGQLQPAVKDSTNPFFQSKYADLLSVWESCRALLSSNGLAVIQTTAPHDNMVSVVTTLAHTSGQWIRGTLTLKPVKNDPQGAGSALTYARRYALAAIVGVAPEDDDGNAATRSNGKTEAPASTAEGDDVCAFGKNKGKAWADMSDKQLLFYRDFFQEKANDPKNAKYKDSNERLFSKICSLLDEKTGMNQEIPY